MIQRLRLSFQLLSIFVLAIGLILIGLLSDKIYVFFVGSLGLPAESGFAQFIKAKLGDALGFGVIFLSGAVAVYFMSSGIENFFKNKISPIVTDHVDRLSDELNQVSVDTKKLLGAKMLESVVAASPQSEVRSKLRYIHEKAYGAHCGSELGLYAAVEKKLSMFLDPEKPHRSDYHQTVTVVENSADSITWHEVCSYKIHTLCFENNSDRSDPVEYPIMFSSTIKAAELSFDGDDPKYKLLIMVGEDKIFDSVQDLSLGVGGEVMVNGDIQGVSVDQYSDTLKIIIEKPYQIRKPWIEVEIKETSTIKDDYFISRRNEPTCGAKITMNLPDNWWFELISFGHPDDWTIHQHPTNTLSAFTKSWLLPGITFFCKWERPAMEQGSLLHQD